ncbi:MAG TPA: choice-of-anchor tandem repeat GloVer-containing protein [Lacipirellulaceae bacterium]|nr:choice-of-anchor tandem repeat GloVer-containing protein [Lacipirellulaceae bacterium]
MTVATAVCLATWVAPNVGAATTLLHSFAGYPTDGYYPEYETPLVNGSTIYGLTRNGGSSDYGVVFRVSTVGTEYTVLHNFAPYTMQAPNGREPFGSLALSGSTLYGMTTGGGGSGTGTLFKIDTDGSGFGLLHSFTGGGTDGANPYGSVIISGTTMYGMTYGGGDSPSFGTIFKINVDGSGYTILHDFDGGSTDGANPYGQLTLSGSTLYGMTFRGGSSSNLGTIFKIDTDGNNFSLLHSFLGGSTDGNSPQGSLALAEGTLYGMTTVGGANQGTVFKINTDGSGFGLLHSFVISASDGTNPSGDVTVVGSKLYGMTYGGGSSGIGTVFQMNTDGSGFSLLHSFTGGAADGKRPFGSLSLSGSTLFGLTERGGTSGDGLGTIFAIPVVILPGDYNSDSKVDAADYVVWRKYNNTAMTLPNDSTPGTDVSDYDVWQVHFGQIAGSGSGSSLESTTAGVPESTSTALLFIATIATAMWNRHQYTYRKNNSCSRVDRASASGTR